MIQDLDVLASIAALLEKQCSVPVYLDDVLEGFATPCFFVKAQTLARTESKHLVKKHTDVFITYISESKEKAKEYYRIGDILRVALANGFEVKTDTDRRYLSVGSITESTEGDGAEFLQLEVTIEYYDSVPSGEEKYPIMGTLHYEVEKKG